MRVRTLALLLSLTAPVFAADVKDLAAAYAAPQATAPAPIDKATIAIAHLTIDLGPGKVSTAFAAGKPIGIFYEGAGQYTYRTADPVERTIVLFEAKKLGRDAKKESDGSVSVHGAFGRMYLRGAGVEIPLMTTDASTATAPSPAFAEHLQTFDRATWNPPSHLLIRQRLDAPTVPVAVAEFDGHDDDAYILDSLETKNEELIALITHSTDARMPDELRKAIFPYTISQQPAGRQRGTFVQPRFLLVNVDYTLVAGDKDSAKLSVTETIVPRNTPQTAFRFNLISDRMDTDAHRRMLHLDSVTDGAGHKLPYHFANDSLLIGTNEPLQPNTELTLKFEISGDFLYRPENDNYWSLRTSPWLPEPSRNGQFMTVHSLVKVKKPWIAFATGETIARREEGDYNVLESGSDKPMQFPCVLAGKYNLAEEKHDDVTVKVATYAMRNDRAMDQLPRLAYKIIKFYESWLGPFPSKEFDIIEINDLGWGQSPDGIMFITKEAFNPAISEENRYYSKGINQRFAHEIAHQYWGHVIKAGSYEEQWLEESFAEFSSALVMKEIEGQRGYDDLVQRWKGDAKEAAAVATIPVANNLATPGERYAFEYRFDLVYSKGAYLLTALRKDMGDEKFFLWLRNLQGRYAGRFVTTKDAIDVANKISGKDYQPFFEKYYWGNDVP